MVSTILPPPSPSGPQPRIIRESDDEDADTASQRSISLSSPSHSQRHSLTSDPRQSFATQSSDEYSVGDARNSVSEDDNLSLHLEERQATSMSPPPEFKPVTYPPSPPNRDDAMSVSSFASTSSRKARPESLLITPTNDPLILGVALVDFNHLVRPAELM